LQHKQELTAVVLKQTTKNPKKLDEQKNTYIDKYQLGSHISL
jgi:hypothetical protein